MVATVAMRRRIQVNRILESVGILLMPALFVLLGPSLLLDQSRISLHAFDAVVFVLSANDEKADFL